MDSVNFLKDMYEKFSIRAPDFNITLGSGLSTALTDASLGNCWREVGEIAFKEIPNFTQTTAPGHPGLYRIYQHDSGKVLSLQMGRLHGFEGLEPAKVARSVTQLFDAGTKNFILTNAAGSLDPKFNPGELMLIKDHVNFTGKNPLVGPNPKNEDGKELGPRFPDLAQLWDKELRARLKTSLKKNFTTHEGIYLGVLGPSFETAAEIQLFSKWGLGAVGMSTVWEAIALKHRGATVAGISFISNYGVGLKGEKELTHEAVLKEGEKSARKLIESIFSFFEKDFGS